MAVNDDALVIAKWCWPETRWVMREWNPLDPVHIADAERVLIERGLAEQYGIAMCWALFGEPGEEYDGDLSGWDLYNGEDFAKLATAPLEARVRALAAVIRSLALEL